MTLSLINTAPKQTSLDSIRPCDLPTFDFSLSTTIISDKKNDINLEKLQTSPCYTYAYNAIFDLITSFEIDLNIDKARLFLEIFHKSVSTLLIHEDLIINRLYFYIWHFSKMKNSSIEGDRWGEFHAFDDPEILLISLKAVSIELLAAKIEEELNRIESPIRKIKNKKLSAKDFTEEYQKLFDRYLIFFQNPVGMSDVAIDTIFEKIRLESPSWAKKKENISKSCLEAHQHPLFGKSLFWITGSSNHSLVGVIKGAELTSCDFTPSLIPTGLLLKQNIAPLSGELGDGITESGVNQKHLSGVAAPFYKEAVIYSLRSSFYFSKDKAKSKLDQLLLDLFKTPPETISLSDLYKLKIALIRVFEYTDISEEFITLVYSQLHSWIVANTIEMKCQSYLKDDLFPYLEKFKKTFPLPMIQSIIESKAHPLIYGMSEENPSLINRRIKSDVPGEIALKGPLKLSEKSIDFAITSDSTSSFILNKILPFPVLSFEAGCYLLQQQKHIN